MTIFRSEDMLVGLIALAVVPWIGSVLVRGRRLQRLPLGRAYVSQVERPGAFTALFAFYLACAALMLFITLDLMLGLGARS